ncbi:hypothetical protein DMUE_5453 [Dictyocoela muelleri]|nr:hypothetical protein DMUE_5453 [Dictyocoela muelleri]
MKFIQNQLGYYHACARVYLTKKTNLITSGMKILYNYLSQSSNIYTNKEITSGFIVFFIISLIILCFYYKELKSEFLKLIKIKPKPFHIFFLILTYLLKIGIDIVFKLRKPKNQNDIELIMKNNFFLMSIYIIFLVRFLKK